MHIIIMEKVSADGGITEGTVGGKDWVGQAVDHDGAVDTTVATVVVVAVGIGAAVAVTSRDCKASIEGSPGRPRDGHSSLRPGGS